MSIVVTIADQVVSGGIVAGGVAVVAALAGRGMTCPRPARPAPQSPTTVALALEAPGGVECPGRLTLHEDGSTSCHGGLADCWGGAGYQHGAPIACTSVSHGCGRCQMSGWAS